MPRVGICPICDKGPKKLPYLHPDGTGQNVCHTCYARILRYRAKGITRSLPVVKAKKDKKLEGRKIKYPDRDSVEEALKLRDREGKENYLGKLALEDMTLYRAVHKFEVNLPKKESQRRETVAAKKVRRSVRLTKTPVVVPSPAPAPTIREREESVEKPGKETKYPTREAVIAVLEGREAQGEENFPNIIEVEDNLLYQALFTFEVELSGKESLLERYHLGDLVKNENPKDLVICGKIGTVATVSEKEVRVDFKERSLPKIIRVYEKWRNLNNIILYSRETRRVAKKIPESMALA